MKIWSCPIAQNMNEKFEKFCPEHLGQNFSNIFVHILGIQRVPALRGFWDFEKTALGEIRVSGTVGGPLITRRSPT